MTEMTLRDIAQHADLSPATIRRLHADATKARRLKIETPRHMPAPSSTTDYGALLWNAEQIDEWLEARAIPARKGAVPKSVLQEAIKELKRNRPNAALRVLEGAL